MQSSKILQVEHVLLQAMDGHSMVAVAGPCLAESLALCQITAHSLKATCHELGINLVFKASADKANRSDPLGARGPGFNEGIGYLRAVAEDIGVLTTTDVHTPTQAGMAAIYVDMLQTPALLMRQTDLMHACGEAGLPVNVKKGQFATAATAAKAVYKVQNSQQTPLTNCITERGTTFGGDGDVVVDVRNIARMKELCPECCVLIDATHTVQRQPSSIAQMSSAGDRDLSLTIALAGLAAGADGVFVECHPDPEQALSDAAIQTPLQDMHRFLTKCRNVWEASR